MWIKLTKVYKEMLHTENLSSISSSFREEEFWSLSSLFLCSNLWPQEWDQFWPQRNHMNKIDKGPQRDDKTKYKSSNPSSFREEEFWSWFSLFLCSNLWPPGWGQFWPHEHNMNKLGGCPQGDAKNQISKLYTFQFQRKRILKMGFFVPMFQLVTHGLGPILTLGASYEETW